MGEQERDGGRGGRRRKDPFAMIERSHGRLLEELTRLRAAAAQVAVGRGDDGARADLEEVLGFFEGPVARHEADEEESLFPRLRGRGLDELLDALATEHRQHEEMHARLRALLARPLDRQAGLELARLGEELLRAYRVHLDAEERELLPQARRLLAEPDRAALLREMQTRRGR